MSDAASRKSPIGTTPTAQRVSPLKLIAITAAIAFAITAVLSVYPYFRSGAFRFLDDHAGWDIPFSFLPYATGDAYWYVFLVGLTNTIGTGIIAICTATAVGFLVGVVRLSGNHLLADLGRIYVDVIRNIPLILQAAFWYAVLLHLPPIRAAYSLFGVVFLSNRGLLLPKFSQTGFVIACLVFAAIAALSLIKYFRRGAGVADRQPALLALGLAGTAATIAVLLIQPEAFRFDLPARAGLNYQGGLKLAPEFVALLVAITVYRGAFIAEVFRGGLQSVPRGQMDAARSLGLKPWMALFKIRLPLALISIVPALTSEFIVIMKVTSIGIVVGFWDLFAVSSNSAMMTGRTIEVLVVMIAIYIALNFAIVLLMNLLNNRMRLPGNDR